MAIYLDYNATAPLRPAAATAMQDAMGAPANPSSIHSFGRQARLKVEVARQQVADLLGVRHADLVFTSGGTEANNMVLQGYKYCVVSAIEHDGVLRVRPDAHRLPVSSAGQVLPEALEQYLSQQPPETLAKTLVCVMAANNETGVLQPIAELAEICKRYQVHIHSDMVQIAGKVGVNPAALGLDFATFSAHKLGGPTGVGALWIRAGLTIPALLVGGGQEQGRRSGTENVIGIIGFGAASAVAASYDWDEVERIRDKTIAHIRSAAPQIILLGEGADRLPNTICLGLPGVKSETIVMALDLRGFAVSSGAACSSGKIQPSHVATAMGRADIAGSVLRISAGWDTRASEMQQLAETVVELYKQLTN